MQPPRTLEMGRAAPLGSIGTALDAASGTSPPIRPRFPLLLYDTRHWGTLWGGGGDPSCIPLRIHGPAKGKPSHCEYLRPAVPSPSHNPELDLGAAQLQYGRDG